MPATRYAAFAWSRMQKRKGTLIADHLRLVLSVIDGPGFPLKHDQRAER